MEVTDEPRSILKLPTEVQLIVLGFLDVADVLAVRLTCTTLYKTSLERTLWMSHLLQQQKYLPYPQDLLDGLRNEDQHLTRYPDSAIESFVRRAHRTSKLWFEPREGYRKLQQGQHSRGSLTGVELLGERWLLVLYSEGAMYLYDIGAPGRELKGETNLQPFLRASVVMNASPHWMSYSAVLGDNGNTLYVAVARSQMPFHVQLYQVDLEFLSSRPQLIRGAFRLIQTFHSTTNRVVRALDAQQRLLIISTSSLVEVVRWEGGTIGGGPAKAMIKVHPEDMEDLWNGVITAQFMGPHILVFKTRSLEVHQYTNLLVPPPSPSSTTSSPRSSQRTPSPPGPQPAPLKSMFTFTFRDVSFSECTVTHDPLTGTDVYEKMFMAYDVIHGVFHFVVRLMVPTTPSTSPSLASSNSVSSPTANSSTMATNTAPAALPPTLTVTLTGVYPLALGLSLGLAGTQYYKPISQVPSAPSPIPTSPFMSVYVPTSAPRVTHPHLLSMNQRLSASSSTSTPTSTPSSSTPNPTRRVPTSTSTWNPITQRSDIPGPSPMPRPTPVPTPTVQESASRGFISTHRVGLQGKRAVWVERKRSSTSREVQVWGVDPPPSSYSSSHSSSSEDDQEGKDEDEGLAREIERRVVYTLHSYDLSDDITCCAIGEISGMIVLGHRSGEISVVDLPGSASGSG